MKHRLVDHNIRYEDISIYYCRRCISSNGFLESGQIKSVPKVSWYTAWETRIKSFKDKQRYPNEINSSKESMQYKNMQ